MGHRRVAWGGLFLFALGACGSPAATPDGGHHATDGANDASTIPIHGGDGSADASRSDAASCGCTTDGAVLHMSWACFCRSYDCSLKANTTTCGPLLSWTSACGFRVRSWNTSDGRNTQVFDATGALVGVRLNGAYSCSGPVDGGATVLVQAGELPADSCQATPCDCNLDGTISCGTADGG